jgi:hypothetical protein
MRDAVWLRGLAVTLSLDLATTYASYPPPLREGHKEVTPGTLAAADKVVGMVNRL